MKTDNNNSAASDLNIPSGYVQPKRVRIYSETVDKYHDKLERKKANHGKITLFDAQNLMRDAVAYALSQT